MKIYNDKFYKVLSLSGNGELLEARNLTSIEEIKNLINLHNEKLRCDGFIINPNKYIICITTIERAFDDNGILHHEIISTDRYDIWPK